MLTEYVAPRSWRPGWGAGLTNKTHCFYAYRIADLLKQLKIDSLEPKKRGKSTVERKQKWMHFAIDS